MATYEVTDLAGELVGHYTAASADEAKWDAHEDTGIEFIELTAEDLDAQQGEGDKG